MTTPGSQLKPGGIGLLIGSLATATDRLSGAALLAITGAMFSLGHDGLTPMLGLVAGLALSGLLVAPGISRAHSEGVLAFIKARYGRIAYAVAVVVAAAAAVVLLAAELSAIALALRVGTGIDWPQSLALGLLVVALFTIISGERSTTWLQALLFPLIALALLLPLLLSILSAQTQLLPPHLTYGPALQSISELELKLLESELADPVSLKAFLRPFISTSAPGALLLTLSLALGVAVLPTTNRRPALARSSDDARLIVAFGVLLMVLALLALPPFAAATRLALLSEIVGKDVGALPPLVFEQGHLGLLRICGVAPLNQETVSAACAALEVPPQQLRLEDIDIAQDGALVAMAGLQGLPLPARYALAAAIGLASLGGAVWLLLSVRRSLRGPSVGGEDPDRSATRIAGHVVLLILAAGATYWASTKPDDILTLMSWGLSLAAGGLAPALLAGLWWSRATSAAAVAGMLTGFGVAGYYILATHYFPHAFFDLWSPLSDAGYGALLDFEAAKEALTSAPAGEAKALAEAVESAARPIANWWGVRNVAAGALGAGAGLAVTVILSFLTPRPKGEAAATIARLRTPDPRV